MDIDEEGSRREQEMDWEMEVDERIQGALGTPGAGAGAVVERVAPVSSSDNREDRLVDHQATGFLSTTGGEGGGRKHKMDSTTKECNVTAAGELGAPGAGAGVVVKQATPASLSDDCGARLVDHQASGALTATGAGRGSNTPSEAVPGPSGKARPMTGGAPMVRLRRLPDGLVRCSSSRSIDRVVAISDDEDGDSDASAVSASSFRSGVVSSGASTGRKRGRLPAARERLGLAEAKRKLIKLTLKGQGLREEDIEDRAVPPPPVSKSCKRLPPADAVAEEMRCAPTPDLGAVINDRIQVIEKVARCSANLKGTNVRALREAALQIRYAAAEQAKPTVLSERELVLESEVRDLRARLTAVEALPARREAGRTSPVAEVLAGSVAGTTGAPVPMEVSMEGGDPVGALMPPPPVPPARGPAGSGAVALPPLPPRRRLERAASAAVAAMEPRPAPRSPPPGGVCREERPVAMAATEDAVSPAPTDSSPGTAPESRRAAARPDKIREALGRPRGQRVITHHTTMEEAGAGDP
ncbi:hypothetical protein WN55_05328 [Dufourea novaeangliae]|uniref:Uncharacterized protein n=1 Tax=Dufourea novaeangliae TaxID=178035 RepID=A0A154PLE6_DUFNO|nr:hypothetical protein WN55_05328 [Dufourea novaeangliae]